MPDFVNDNVALPEPKNEQTVPLGKEARFLRGQDYNALRDAALSLRTARTADVAAQATKDALHDAGLALASNGAYAAGVNRLTDLETHTSGWVNVRSYGAKGDGVTDDTAAIQSMLAALGAAPRTIVIDGPCVVNANLTIPANQPVRMEGNGAFVGTGVVTYQPWGVTGSSAPTVRRLEGVLAQDFSSGTFSVATNPTATGATATEDDRGAQKITWASATASQFGGVKALGTWDFSTSDLFALDVGFDTAETKTYFQIFLCFDTGTTFTNYAVSPTFLLSNQIKPPRFTLPFLKSAMTVTGTPAWSAVRRIEIRYYRSPDAITAAANTAYVYGFWSHLAARTKVILTFDDGARNQYLNIFPIMQAAGLRGTVYVNGATVGGGSQITLAHLKEMQAAGWDIGCHTWAHTYLSQWFATLTRSGTVATAVLPSTEPHGFIVGSIAKIRGADEAGWNGDVTVTGVPNAYTFTYTVSSALENSATGRVHMINASTPARSRSALRLNAEWLTANGFARNGLHHAYPAGYFDDVAIGILQDLGYKTGRGTHSWPFGNAEESISSHTGLFNKYELPSLSIGDPTTPASILAKVDIAVSKGTSLFLNGHDVQPTAASSYTMTTANFQALIDGLKARRDAGQIDVVTVSEWFNRL
jgi:peptidoglycan/xylan/chitin deacetylase (PgdA/CDA1 family)